MFDYVSYEEATAMKERISDAILRAHDSVSSIGTEETKSNTSTIYSVKIGMVDASDKGECDKVLETLHRSNILLDSPQKIGHERKYSPFKQVGVISAQGNSASNLTYLYSRAANSKRHLGLALVAGGIGLAACLYKAKN